MSRISKIDKLGFNWPIVSSLNHKVCRFNIPVNYSNFVKNQNTLDNLFKNTDNLESVKFSFSWEVLLKIFIIKIHINDIVSILAQGPLLRDSR